LKILLLKRLCNRIATVLQLTVLTFETRFSHVVNNRVLD
jgi:hypothetical protein